jgi:beta-galactosidase/beta-glucuronidase
MTARFGKAALIAINSPALVGLVLALTPGICADEFAADLPGGVKAVWDLDKAAREATLTSERVCINGLWRWQPAEAGPEQVPAQGWGYFKVPGCWPGITDYMQKDSQTVFAHPTWKSTRLGSLNAAWYEREVAIPDTWAARRIALTVEYLNSFASVFVDGKKVGELRFPGGALDLTQACRPGGRYRLSMLVAALPLKGVLTSYIDTATARAVRATVPRRGLCGDVYLEGTPAGARIADVKVETSVRQGQITFNAALEGLAPRTRYTLHARIRQNGADVAAFDSKLLTADDLEGGRFTYRAPWKPDRLWDIHQPGNQYVLELSLRDIDGQPIDTAHEVRFGFREFWISGRDFYLNGTRIFLCAVPFDNAQISAAMAGYEGARESLLRLKAIGINMVYTHNYGCEPGSHLSFAEVLRAADDVGMLVSFSQPHFSHYDWQTEGADANNGYRSHAEFYVRKAQHTPRSCSTR